MNNTIKRKFLNMFHRIGILKYNKILKKTVKLGSLL